jgi:hypothetical protein
MSTRSVAFLAIACLSSLAAGTAKAAVEVMPTLGIGKPTGNGSDSFDYGLHGGVSVGGRLVPMLSLHGQLKLDWLSPDSPPGGESSGYMAALQVAPLFHIATPKIDFVVGPTLGFFFMSLSTEALNIEATADARGIQLGFQAALLITVSPTAAIGPFLDFSRQWATRLCTNLAGGSTEVCDDSPENDDEGFLRFGVAAWF